MKTFPYKMIDLTHTLHADTPSWDGGCGFKQSIKLDYNDCGHGITFRVQQLNMHAGIGTHIDAPAHCDPEGATIEALPLDTLVSPCVLIDVSHHTEENYTVSPEDIERFEKEHGHIMPGTFVMIRTGWEKYWQDAKKYCNEHVFPAVSEAAAMLLLSRHISGLGIDTLSADRPDAGFPVHHLLLKAGKYLIENAANLSALPTTGSFILAMPIKGKDLTEAPIRLIGLTAA